MLLLLGTSDDNIDQAQIYLQNNFVGMLFLFGYNYISTVLRALGDSQTPLRIVSVAVCLNGIVRASGDMYQVLVLNLISFWILRYPFTAIFSNDHDELGIPLGIGLSFIVSCFIATLYYMYGK